MRKFHGIAATCLLLTSGTAKAVDFGCTVQSNCFSASAFSGLTAVGAGSSGGAGFRTASRSYANSSLRVSGSSSASLASGEIFVSAAGPQGSIGGALFERFIVDLPDGMGAQEAEVVWKVSGSTDFTSQINPNGFWATFDLQGNQRFGPGSDRVQFTALSSNFSAEGHPTPAFWSAGNHDLVFTGTINISEGWIYQLNKSLNVGYFGPAEISYLSKLAIYLPLGANIISASDVFLSEVPGPAIPEPASWAMMIAGFGLTGAALRRRRQLDAVGTTPPEPQAIPQAATPARWPVNSSTLLQHMDIV